MQKKKNRTVGKVLSHLKEDEREYKEMIKDDQKLKKEIKKKGK